MELEQINKLTKPNPEGFACDPFGYSALAWHKWGMAQTIAGFEVDITKPPTSDDLKSPVLWLSQAHALNQAAINLLNHEPDLSAMPEPIQSCTHSQYYAIVLMLFGYSLEVCLKAMIILKNGIEEYNKVEKQHKHHRLEQLANFIPSLSSKDKAGLKALTHFVYWAGRYPDPGSSRNNDVEDIFNLSEKHQIVAKDLFELVSKIMKHVEIIADESR